jgi:hypothetical protein
MANAPQQDLSAIIEGMKSALQRIVQSKNNPQEVERAVAEGQKQLDALATGQPGSPSQSR